MAIDVLKTYKGELAPEQEKFLHELVAHGLGLEVAGPANKTIQIHFNDRQLGLIDNTVRGLFLYRFLDPKDPKRDNNACPPELLSNLEQWACKRFACNRADIHIRWGNPKAKSENRRRTFLHIKSVPVAFRALGVDSLITPKASDITNPPERVATTTYRVLRDTALARRVKLMHNFECQICGRTIALPDGSRYAEAHHVKPLGDPHSGPDVIGNIVCLCPNHHAMCDLGAIELSLSSLKSVDNHNINQQFIDYHNLEIHGGTK